MKRHGFTDDDIAHVPDRLVDAIVAWGNVDAIRRRVEEHLEAGADHVCVQVLPREGRGGLPLRVWRELAPALTSL